MKEKIQHIEESLARSYSYSDYQKLVADLLAKGESTTEGAGEDFVHYSKLGLQRMQRWDKRFQLSAEQTEKIKSFSKKQTWVVLTEGWCGDAAHSLPVIHKMAEANANINLRLVLRDKNPDLMNDFLTNGGKSIPKLIVYDPETKTVEGDWGPRPQPAQEIFLNAQKNKVDFETYEKELQVWYNKDKGQTATNELIELLDRIN